MRSGERQPHLRRGGVKKRCFTLTRPFSRANYSLCHAGRDSAVLGGHAQDVVHAAWRSDAEGFTTTFRNFDVQTQKVKLEQLSVAGVEKVTVPAGTFDAYRVEITSADGGSDKKTVWIAKDSHKVMKATAVLASMGGALFTEEAVD